ncbi:beta-hydroxylase [Nitzschia inconspicua]|uniref:Beta-hydroxylase n=1 Tax=Nitzschia inconspicua TaxID=303405 RepID=A0A9K3PFW7_9STRA|nr:beta-hydroxylase [Nitzschia inconspicua]
MTDRLTYQASDTRAEVCWIAQTTHCQAMSVRSLRCCPLTLAATSSLPSSLPDTSRPLSPHTFAGMVEQGLKERFDEREIERVLTSWRLLDQEYYRKEFVGNDPSIDSEDLVQECHSYLPGLSIQPFWNAKDFGWANYLESRYSEIRKEFDAVTANMAKLQNEGNNIWAGALTTDAASYGEGWKTLVLMDRGRWDPTNVNLFPITAQAVHDSGVPATEVFFASMAGPSEIKKHSDFTNFVLTSHLALDIPDSGNNKCRLTVGGVTNQWINGHCYVFDTSLLHDAVNESDQTRYILMLRLWHPDLTLVEQQALQFTFDCLEFPGLVSPDPGERFMAEQTVEAIRNFPILRNNNNPSEIRGFDTKSKQNNNKRKGSGKKKGFGR